MVKRSKENYLRKTYLDPVRKINAENRSNLEESDEAYTRRKGRRHGARP